MSTCSPLTLLHNLKAGKLPSASYNGAGTACARLAGLGDSIVARAAALSLEAEEKDQPHRRQPHGTCAHVCTVSGAAEPALLATSQLSCLSQIAKQLNDEECQALGTKVARNLLRLQESFKTSAAQTVRHVPLGSAVQCNVHSTNNS